MKLTTVQSYGPVRFTRKDDPGVWCSRECRGGKNVHAPGTCQSCKGSLAGVRKGAKFCSDTCRSREHRVPQTPQYSRCTPRKTKVLTGAGGGFGCPYTKTAGNGHFAMENRGSRLLQRIWPYIPV